MKRIIKEYFTFSRKEKVVVIILLLLIVVFIFLPYLFEIKKSKPIVDEELQQQLVKWSQNKTRSDSLKDDNAVSSISANETKYESFLFDPNTLDTIGWGKLGLSNRVIHTILNYRNKGGRFYQPEDIRKIWGLQKVDADRIIPFARIKIGSSRFQKNNFNHTSTVTSINIGVLDINTATADQLMQIPGIGHSLPFRIINYRDKLGGFWDLLQLKQTYGMTDSIFQLIIPFLKTEPSTCKKININTATDFELSQNPVISKDIAKAIVIYRNQHGSFIRLDDIKRIVFITEEVYSKIVPYLTIN